jgi:hypothetical protein
VHGGAWVGVGALEALDAYRTGVELVPAEPPTADRARVLAGLARIQGLSPHDMEAVATAEQAIGVASASGPGTPSPAPATPSA